MGGDTFTISPDRPLCASDALDSDLLERSGFATAAVNALRRVSSTAGFVLSVEGPWGSGKTSALSMMEQILKGEDSKNCVIVHFNPWLVGDRDSLLRHFFSVIADEISLSDSADSAAKVSKELRNYAGIFDVLRFVPGAEPWASIVKSLMQSAGKAAAGFAEQKGKDLEAQKSVLEASLQAYNKKIYVFVDDVDRLFPSEVFEVVRIIKALGELPNIGYIVAWDPEYISKALKLADVPYAESYVDKIVQVRLPLPAISSSSRMRLLNRGLESLPDLAHSTNFPKQDERLSSLYFHGLKDLLQQPRDIARVINTLSVIEPELRGEIVLADILGLACLMVKAPVVYHELRKNHSLFTDSVDSNALGGDKKAKRSKRLRKLFGKCQHSEAVAKMVNFLFPNTARVLGGFSPNASIDVEGHLAAASRVGIALGMRIGGSDVSLVDARRYLFEPAAREAVIRKLNAESAMGFLEALGDLAGTLKTEPPEGLEGVCTAIACLVDESSIIFVEARRPFFTLPAETLAVRAIRQAVLAISPDKAASVAHVLASNPRTLTVGAEILRGSRSSDREQGDIVCSKEHVDRLTTKLSNNSKKALQEGRFWSLANPSRVLWTVMRGSRSSAQSLFKALKSEDGTLDKFAIYFLKHSFSSNGGQSYAFPGDEAASKLVKLETLQRHARLRLKEESVTYPVRAAWQSVVDEKELFGEDGADASR